VVPLVVDGAIGADLEASIAGLVCGPSMLRGNKMSSIPET
jgi:hypothetical protein